MLTRDQILGLAIFSIGAVVLFGSKLSFLLHNLYYLFAFTFVILLVAIVLKYKKTLKIKIENYELKNNIILAKINEKYYYVLAFRVDVKIDPSKDKAYTFKNYLLLLKTIEKRAENGIRVVLVNNMYPKPGTYMIILKEKKEEYKDLESLVNFSMQLKSIVEGLEDGIELTTARITGDYIAIPTGLGAVVYPTVLGSSIKVPQSLYLYQLNNAERFIELGETHDGKPVGISEEEITRHIAIFGATGSGKTNTAILLASQVAQKGYTVVILDWHGEYSKYLRFAHLFGDNLPPINPLGLAKVEEIADLLGNVLELTEPQKFLLYLILLKLKSIGQFELQMIVDMIREIEDTSSWIRDVKYALLRKLILMFSDEGRKLFSSTGESLETLGDLLENKKNVIIDLSLIESETLKRLYALFVLLFFAHYKMKKRSDTKSLIIIDESQNYFVENKNVIIDRILREYRKFGVSLCLVTQSPSAVSDDVLKNTNVKIIHSIKSNLDKKIISESTALPKELTDYLDKLDPGEAICSCTSEKVPIVIRVKKVQPLS